MRTAGYSPYFVTPQQPTFRANAIDPGKQPGPVEIVFQLNDSNGLSDLSKLLRENNLALIPYTHAKGAYRISAIAETDLVEKIQELLNNAGASEVRIGKALPASAS